MLFRTFFTGLTAGPRAVRVGTDSAVCAPTDIGLETLLPAVRGLMLELYIGLRMFELGLSTFGQSIPGEFGLRTFALCC